MKNTDKDEYQEALFKLARKLQARSIQYEKTNRNSHTATALNVLSEILHAVALTAQEMDNKRNKGHDDEGD